MTTITTMNTRTIETIERDAWLDLFEAAPAEVAAELGLAQVRIGTLGLLASRAMPITECNRVMGVGVQEPATEALLADAAAWLDRYAGRTWAVQVSPMGATAGTLDWLGRRGLAPGGNGWAKFHLDASSPVKPPPVTTLEIRLVDRNGAEDFGRTVQAGFGFPRACANWIAALASRPGWRAYLAYDHAAPVAAAAMFIDGKTAWLGMAATLPGFRRRGAQGSLIARRVADGLAEGVATFTGETVYAGEGGSASTSFTNFGRAGFDLAYVRPNYRLPDDTHLASAA